jgi:hypothetical protein
VQDGVKNSTALGTAMDSWGLSFWEQSDSPSGVFRVSLTVAGALEINDQEFEVTFHSDSNNSGVFIEAFSDLGRSVEYRIQFQSFRFIRAEDTLEIKGRYQTGDRYILAISP